MQNASNKDPASFGGQGTEAEQRWYQPRRKRNGALRGVCPLNSYGAVETVFGPGSCTISNRRPLRDCPSARGAGSKKCCLPARAGSIEETMYACSYAASAPSRMLLLISLVYGVLASWCRPQGCTSGSRHTQDDNAPSRAGRKVREEWSALSDAAMSRRVMSKLLTGWDSCSFGSRAVE